MSCQPRVKVTSCLFTKLSGTYNRYITCVLILSAGLIYKIFIDSRKLKGVYKLMFYLAIVKKKYCVTVTLGWQDSNSQSLFCCLRSCLFIFLGGLYCNMDPDQNAP